MVLLQNQMIQGKNLKLKLGLCGLALTSFLALNARGNTVHADTVSGNNADAITWDADNDDSQVVKQDTQQSQSSHSVQIKNAPATQSVQSNVQEKKQIAVSSVSSMSAVQKRAEMGIVRQSNAQTSTVNRLNANVARNNQVKVANVHATADQHVQISNPQNNQVVVHYVKSNGQSAGLADQTIDVTKGDGKYNAPSGYNLVRSDGSYKVSSTDNGATASVTMKAYDGSKYQSVPVNDSAVTNDILGIIKDDIRTNYSSLPFQDGSDPMSHVKSYSVVGQILGKNPDSGLTVDFSMGNGTADGQGVGLTYIYSYYDSHSGQEAQGSRNVAIPTGIGQDLEDYYNKYTRSILNSNGTGVWFGGDSNGSDRLIMGDVSMNHSYTFNDGGSATSSVGNHINVPVTKPQNVDPNSAQCKRQAMRVIHIAFPNGVKPKSYDSIADSAGNKLTFDSNNNLTQTVTFTRSVTVDGLTGATLNQTPWQQHGAINAVTLPDIPGYTMVTTN